MKIYTILILSLILFGCSSTYTVKDFSSRKKFNSDFDKSVKDKKVFITLINDSTLVALNGARIVNDYLDIILNVKNEKKIIPFSKIKNIRYHYTGYSNHSADIILKSGKKIEGKNVKTLPDSSLQYTTLKKDCKIVPISEIKSVSYKNHWLGALIGIPAGTFAGFGLRLFASTGYNGGVNNKNANITFVSFLFGGPIVGAILGSIVGYTYTYQFNP